MQRAHWGQAMNETTIFSIAAAGLGLAGVIVLILALFRDRARGRRRCPKCWYDLSVSGEGNLRCSECGYKARRERKLYKTRRHWRWAGVGVVLLLGSYACRVTPDVRRHGWWSAVPTTLIIAVSPKVDLDESALIDSLLARADRDEIADWQWDWFVLWGLKDGDRLVTPKITTRNGWVRNVPLMAKLDFIFHSSSSRAVSATATPIAPGGKPIFASRHPIALVSFDSGVAQDAGTIDVESIMDWEVEIKTNIGRRQLSWTKRIRHPVWFSDRVDYLIEPATDPIVNQLIAEHIDALVMENSVYFYFDRGDIEIYPRRELLEAVFKNVTFAVNVELIFGEDVVAEQSAWCGSDPRQSCNGMVVPNMLEQLSIDLRRQLAANPDQWRVRISPNPQLALNDFDSFLYWNGELTLPVWVRSVDLSY